MSVMPVMLHMSFMSSSFLDSCLSPFHMWVWDALSASMIAYFCHLFFFFFLNFPIFHPQVVFKPLLSYTGIQAQDTTPLSYKMYFGEHLSFSGNLECLRADIVDSDTSKERKNKRSRR